MRTTLVCFVVSVILAALGASRVAAQTVQHSFEVGGEVAFLRLSDLDTTDVGVGANAALRLTPMIAIDGTLAWFPGSGERSAGNLERQQRLLGLGGVKLGVARERVDLFGRARVGFLRFAQQEAVVCIAIFPPPLECVLASGHTAVAGDLGGGVSIGLDDPGRLRLNVGVSDLLIRYGFLSHNLLVTAGFGWRF